MALHLLRPHSAHCLAVAGRSAGRHTALQHSNDSLKIHLLSSASLAGKPGSPAAIASPPAALAPGLAGMSAAHLSQHMAGLGLGSPVRAQAASPGAAPCSPGKPPQPWQGGASPGRPAVPAQALEGAPFPQGSPVRGTLRLNARLSPTEELRVEMAGAGTASVVSPHARPTPPLFIPAVYPTGQQGL